MSYVLTLYSEKGEPLTNEEIDNNFRYLQNNRTFTGSVTIRGGLYVSGSNTFVNTGPFYQDGNVYLSGSIQGVYNVGTDVLTNDLYYTGSNFTNDITLVLSSSNDVEIYLDSPHSHSIGTQIKMTVIANADATYTFRTYPAGNNFITYWNGAPTLVNINERSLSGVTAGTWTSLGNDPFNGVILSGSREIKFICLPVNILDSSSAVSSNNKWMPRLISKVNYVV